MLAVVLCRDEVRGGKDLLVVAGATVVDELVLLLVVVRVAPESWC